MNFIKVGDKFINLALVRFVQVVEDGIVLYSNQIGSSSNLIGVDCLEFTGEEAEAIERYLDAFSHILIFPSQS